MNVKVSKWRNQSPRCNHTLFATVFAQRASFDAKNDFTRRVFRRLRVTLTVLIIYNAVTKVIFTK